MKFAHQAAFTASRFISNVIPKRLFTSPRFFRVWEAKGYHVVPLFYESPVPQPAELEEELWQRASHMAGVDMKASTQLDLLELFKSRFKAEYDSFPRSATNGGKRFHLNNGWFEKVDAEILYSMIRYFQPARIIEVGSGVTTQLSAQAIQKNQHEDPSYRCEFTSIEPFPVRLDPDALPPDFKSIVDRVQRVPLDRFACHRRK